MKIAVNGHHHMRGVRPPLHERSVATAVQEDSAVVNIQKAVWMLTLTEWRTPRKLIKLRVLQTLFKC